ncbi:MAG: hypothetical protein IKE01_05865 [Clostridia bacterium]|nr:hypothetical protein [Clostridia bacterium]
MSEKIEFGIGFLAGRPNVCRIINNYYKSILEQGKMSGKKVNFTFFILFDLNYQMTARNEFYNIIPSVYKNMNVKYITPEDIEEEKKILASRYKIKKDEIDLILGNGYAKARNSIMYFALKRKIDYLLFWDDDEYPVSCIEKNEELHWQQENNILTHLNNIENAHITFGHRCGYMSPIPPIEFGKTISEDDFRRYIEGVSNEAVTWEGVKKQLKENKNGISFANKNILKDRKVVEMQDVGTKNWVLASGICINLRKLHDVPPFFNPFQARGEDAFFSTFLGDKTCLSVPTYHFHDSFLRYTGIPKRKYPTELQKINLEDGSIEERFFWASVGWIKYKPLLIYITDKENYRDIIDKTRKNLEMSIPKINKIFTKIDFTRLIDVLDRFDKKVEDDYDEYIRTFEAWKKFKEKIFYGK